MAKHLDVVVVINLLVKRLIRTVLIKTLHIITLYYFYLQCEANSDASRLKLLMVL